MALYMWQPVGAALNVFKFLYFLYFLNYFYQCLRTVMCSLRFESIRKHWIMIIFILAFFIGSSGAVSSAENFDSVIYSREELLTLQYTAMSSVPKWIFLWI